MLWVPTSNDLAELRMAFNTLNDPCGCLVAPDCLCNASTVVALTCGYVEIWNNGEVVFNGHTLFNVTRPMPSEVLIPAGVRLLGS